MIVIMALMMIMMMMMTMIMMMTALLQPYPHFRCATVDTKLVLSQGSKRILQYSDSECSIRTVNEMNPIGA